MPDRPLLLLDVDGPLNPYGAKPERRPAGYATHRLTPTGWIKLLRVWLNPSHGPMLMEFAERAGMELAWATTWSADANTMIGPLIGLPELPVIMLKPGFYLEWKWTAVAAFAAGRPLAWLDDDFMAWRHLRTGFDSARRGIPTLLHHVDPRIGITSADLDAVEEWVHLHGSDDDEECE